MQKEYTIEDLDEIPVWRRQDAFMELFFPILNEEPETGIMTSIQNAYHKAELVWVHQYGGRAYVSEECFKRIYYRYLNKKNPKKTKPTAQLSLF